MGGGLNKNVNGTAWKSACKLICASGQGGEGEGADGAAGSMKGQEETLNVNLSRPLQTGDLQLQHKRREVLLCGAGSPRSGTCSPIRGRGGNSYTVPVAPARPGQLGSMRVAGVPGRPKVRLD